MTALRCLSLPNYEMNCRSKWKGFRSFAAQCILFCGQPLQEPILAHSLGSHKLVDFRCLKKCLLLAIMSRRVSVRFNLTITHVGEQSFAESLHRWSVSLKRCGKCLIHWQILWMLILCIVHFLWLVWIYVSRVHCNKVVGFFTFSLKWGSCTS